VVTIAGILASVALHELAQPHPEDPSEKPRRPTCIPSLSLARSGHVKRNATVTVVARQYVRLSQGWSVKFGSRS
jgi:hypothetical protein